MRSFNPSRLTLARKRRGLLKIRLARLVDLTLRSISAFESGELPPSDDTLAQIAKVLGFPVDFFFGDDLEEPTLEGVSFRSMKRMVSSQRDSALSAGAMAFLLNDWVEERFHLPKTALLDLRSEDPEVAAELLRQHWGLGDLSIRNTVHLLEAKGVRVFSLAENAEEVDAFSFWRGDTAYVFLNTLKSAEHSRFDAAHELGHLVLHRHGAPNGQDAEREANSFASAFLMPRRSVIASAPRVPTIDHLVQLKKKWAVSVAALAYRLHAVGMVSAWHFRSLYIDLGERGYRTNEPAPIQRETSQVWEKVFAALRAERTTKDDIARALHINAEEIEKLVFGLVLLGLSSSQSDRSTTRGRANLRLVN